MQPVLLVAFGGAIGAVLRHLVNLASLRLLGPAFPWGTLAVNVVGSLAMGVFVELLARRFGGSSELRLFVATGVLGGFTTFSAFSLDVAVLVERGAIPQAAGMPRQASSCRSPPCLPDCGSHEASPDAIWPARTRNGLTMAGVEQITVEPGEAGMRLDRWFKTHFPGLGFGHLQKLLRSGQVRVDGGRAKADTRVEPGQVVRVPPLDVDRKGDQPVTARTMRGQDDAAVLAKMTLYEDAAVFVFNKPAGLAVQGGSGVSRHVDDMLESLRNKKGEKPRLVHRLDRDTSGALVVARTRLAAMRLAEAFRGRDAKKTYWALVKGVPKKHEDKISTWLVKEQTIDGDRMRVARHGEAGADHAVSHYRVVEQAGQTLAWLEMEPHTGRTHQLRVHAAHIGHPIIGDPKYFEADTNWDFPGGMQNRLHLHARRIVIPHPNGGKIDVTAPMPPHMRQSWNLLGFDEASAEDNR